MSTEDITDPGIRPRRLTSPTGVNAPREIPPEVSPPPYDDGNTDPGVRRKVKELKRQAAWTGGIGAVLITSITTLITAVMQRPSPEPLPTVQVAKLAATTEDHERRLFSLESILPEVRDDLRFIRLRMTDQYIKKERP